MRMSLVLVCLTSISTILLQICYVGGVSVSGSSPSDIYSSISSKSVPIYNGNLQEKTTSSTLKPFKISESTLTSLNTNLIDNLNTEMSSNSGLGQKTVKILARQVGQQADNNDGSILENTITKIRPSEMSSGSSQSSTTIPNFENPVHVNIGPGLSNIHHETSKIIDTSRINEVNQLDGSSGTDGEFQFGEFGRLSGSISENDLNLVDSPGGLNKKSGRKVDSNRRGQSRRINLLSGSGGSTEFNVGYEVGKGATEELGKDRGFSGSSGSISFGRNNGGRKVGSAGEEGRNTRFSRSNGLIRFGRKNKSETSGSGGEEQEDIGISRSNGFIRFGRGKKDRKGGLGGEEKRSKGFSGSAGSIRFGRKNKSGTGGSGGEKRGDMGISGSNGSIRFGRGKKDRKGGLGVEEGGRNGFSGSFGSIRFGRKNKSGTEESGGEEGGDIGINRSNGSIRFGRGKKGRKGGLGGEEEESKGFSGSAGSIRFGREGGSGGEEEISKGVSGSVGSIRFGGKNQSGTGESGGEEEESIGFSASDGSIRFGREKKSETGGSGEEKIKMSEKNRPHRTSKLIFDSEMNGGGGKQKFGGSVNGIKFGEESGNKESSKSNRISINRTGENYGVDGYIEDNGFVTEYGTDEESDGGAFGEFSGPENDDS